MAQNYFDPLATTASDLQDMLDRNTLTSVQIVETYLQQIEKFNNKGPCIKALISVAPRDVLVSAAQALDNERAIKKLRGPFHGIPIILKVDMPFALWYTLCLL
jgi:amidase